MYISYKICAFSMLCYIFGMYLYAYAVYCVHVCTYLRLQHMYICTICVQANSAIMELPFARTILYLCPPQNGMTALMMACEHDQMEVVKKLLEMKADPNILDNVCIVYIRM